MRSESWILLYNPISGHGHFDSWLMLAAEGLARRGYRIAILTPDASPLMRLKAQHPDRIYVLPWNLPLADRIRLRWRRFWLKDVEQSYHDPFGMGYRLRDASQLLDGPPTHVIVMYLDIFKRAATAWQGFEAIAPFPLSGLCFAPTPDLIEGYYSLQNMAGLFFLDEKRVEKARGLRPSKRFAFLPDITYIDEEPYVSPLAAEVKRRANGRTIVFLGGAIGRQKNLARWAKLVAMADPGQWFFIQAGEIHEDSLGDDDREHFEPLRNNPPENMLLHIGYLPDERDFNALMRASDIIFAVYREFKVSSNMIAKAAAFSKPILVSDRYLMGERVRASGLGLTVDEDDVDAMMKGLTKLKAFEPVVSAGQEPYEHQYENFISALAKVHEA